jgi:branched-subunit amino acid transport protein
MSSAAAFVVIVGMAAITAVTRGFFLLTDREWPLPGWVMQGLKYAPLSALAAIIVPEVLVTDGALIATWQDARLLAVVAGTAYFVWRRGILGMIVVGTSVMLALRLGLGW